MRLKRNGHKCKRDLCSNRVPNPEMYCCADCQQADRYARSMTEPHYAPLRVYVGRQAYHRIHGKDRLS